MTFTFKSLAEMAQHFSEKGRECRGKADNHRHMPATMARWNAEAYSWEQAAFIAGNAVIEPIEHTQASYPG